MKNKQNSKKQKPDNEIILSAPPPKTPQEIVASKVQALKEQKARSEKVVWRKFGRENTVFEQYYGQQWGLEKAEWKELVAVLQTPPPVYFRINGKYVCLLINCFEPI